MNIIITIEINYRVFRNVVEKDGERCENENCKNRRGQSTDGVIKDKNFFVCFYCCCENAK